MCARQAINLYGERGYAQQGAPEAAAYAHALTSARRLADAFRSEISHFLDELEAARRKLQARLRPPPAKV